MNPFTPKPLPTIPSAVYTHVQLHLRTSIGNPNLPSHVASEDSVLLVEGYISFISKYLENNSEDDIFKAYRLCLAYLKPLYAKGAMVGKKPNSTPLDHRFNLMSCYLRAKKYDNATDHGYILLKDIKEFLGQSWEVGSLVPKLGESAGSCDKQVVALVVNVVRFMLDCNLKFDGSRDVETYNHLLSMIKDIGPWIGLIEKEEDRKKINIDLGRLIKDSTLLLITRLKLQVVKLLDVALLFCKYTFAHQATSNLNDEMYKTGVDILDLCFSTSDLEFQHTKLIIQIVLDALADECKVNQNYGKFLSLVNSCTDQFCIVTNNQKKDVASLFNSLAEKQFFPEGISLVMKLYAIGIVISEDDSCDVQEVFNLLGSTLTRLKCTDMHQELATGAKKLLCARLPVMIMSKSKQITDGLIEDSDPVNLSTIEELLYSDIKGVGDNAGNKQHILALVGACFILSVITKENIKSIDALRKLTADSQSQVDMWKFLSPRLYDVSLTLYKAKRIQEATDSLKLFCEAAWNRVLNFCRMFASRNSDEDFLDETIVGFVQEACKVTICMLSIIEKSDEMHNMLTFVIKKWSKAQSYFPIPPPVELIKQWVQIQCEQIKDPKTLELPPPRTIYSFMPPTCSKEICNIILEQELQGFQDNKMMRDHITKILGENMDRTHYRLKRSKTLVECGMQLRACGTKGLNDCIKYITDAIEIMMSIGKGEGDHQLLWHLMAEAHCLLALCSREARPMSKDYIDHLDEAFMLWQNQECPPDKKTHEKEDFQIHNLTLMFYVADLLLLEGDMEHHSTIIKIIITLLVSKGYSLGECFDIFWRSRQVGCVSTINDAFIKILEDQNESLEILYSKTCINSKAMKVGFQLSLGVVSTFSSFDSCNADDDIHPQITTKEVEDVVSSLIKDDSFLAAQLYYDLGEIYIAKGLLSQAINYAKQSYDWRWEHCKSYFTILPSQGKFVVDYKVTTPACSYDLKSSNLEYIRTPWHVLRCTLESVLQVGRIYNLLEDKMNARSYLINGRSLSSMLNLPLFQASFSCELGKLFRKQHQWDNAKRELDIAQSKLNVIGNNISCLKCKLLLEASIKQERGDLSFDIFKSSNQSDVLNNAKDFYRDAEEKLNHYEWENDVSSPKDASENITMFCDTIDMPTDVATRGRARNCWHCQFSEVTSSSVKRSIKLKWECIRRRLWLRVLIGRGKCYEALKEIENESKVLLYSVSVLVSRSTFQNSHFNISSKCLTTLISHNWMGAGIEPAAVLYQLCCFYLKCINDKDTKCIAVKDIRDIISMSTIVLGLKLSFILSREVPTLFKKVSQLLAALYTIFPSRNDLMLTSTLTESQLGSYFHQACIGTHFNHMFVSRARKLKGATIDGSCTFNSTSRCLGSLPQRVKELENFIMDFFKDLPRITVVCMSFLDDDFKKLLGELLPKTDINRWIMLSRLHSDDVPVSIILPIKNIIGQPIDFKIRATESNILEGPLLTAYGVVPEYKRILEAEEHIMKIGGVKRDNNDRKKLDNELIMFLSHIQSSWFGIWKNMLLGERSDDTELNLIVQELKTDLKDLLGLDIEESILKVVIECGCDAFGELQCLVEAILTKGCYTNGLHRIDKYSKNDITSVDGLIKNACQQTKVECSRKPVILVVDYGIQVLPLESMPILRKKEVYRMPSVTSIVSTLSRRSCYKHGVVMRDIIFPSINPTNAYYLLNVSGDLEVGICKSWFENFQMEGAAMTKPPVEELKLALETHDLFIYISHGHGLQYIPPKVFREIDNCAATLLMGCSSGALEVRGSLAPVGAPLYYLMGGCPAVFCNLWNVVDIEMVDFANELFHGWLNATKSHGYAQRGEDESDGDERSFKKRKIVVDPVSLGSVLTKCREISSEQYLPYLTGAALVCYGVPTFLKKSDVCNAIK